MYRNKQNSIMDIFLYLSILLFHASALLTVTATTTKTILKKRRRRGKNPSMNFNETFISKSK